ncbi:prepilin-type N-terminal cleavage/methylation domain-containing protein [Thermus sp. PS18]|uniref:prepilin-type N-terminal cleavage/methylation domain-containing protein n=1 Tax=Thermus sp. PS18 TaxID=2849039 RepID=UPI0022640422|nr:prepilin-type N-terminal cleavage/methylation domain-containing protein [Thermus sp. PS18]UZX14413.1 prepilin-type N-terminal cleavage/methylation domain-containing protein [Thermus sp. PS18]
MRKGMTLIELLVVVGLLLVIFAIAVFNSRKTLRGQEQAAFLRSLQGFFWQGATEAASRGALLDVVFTGNRLEIRDGARTLRILEVPQGVSLDLPTGVVARLTPPGKVVDATGNNLTQPLRFRVSSDSRSYTYVISLIGEVKVEP